MKSAAPPTTTTPAGSLPVPPGFWGVLRIIATRLPERQLLLLAVVLCGFVLLAMALGIWQLHSLAQPAELPPPHPARVIVVNLATAHASRSCSCWQ